MHRLYVAALVAAGFAAAPPAHSQTLAPFTDPQVCSADGKDLEGCRAALSALLQVEPDNHLARLRMADTDYHLDDAPAAAAGIGAVRARVGPERFEALLAAQKDFIAVGAADCRMILHVTRNEVQWRGPCVAGLADGKGELRTYEGRRAWTQTATLKGGVPVDDAMTWGVEQTGPGAFQHWQWIEGARTHLIKPEQVPAEARPFLAEAVQALPGRLVKARVESSTRADNAKLAVGWPRHCFGYRSLGTERHRLTVQTPGRQAWIAIQPGASCNTATWQLGAAGPGGFEKLAPAGADTVSVDVVLGAGRYVIAVAGGVEPGPYIHTREQLPNGPGVGLGPGAPEPPSQSPGGQASTLEFKALRTYRTGEVIRDCPTCPEMVVVPQGAFMLGSPATEEGRQGAEGPRKQVTFKRAFAIGKYEVTFDEWNACVAAGVCAAKADNGWGQGRRPVINVDYNDTRAYLGWLSKTTGYLYFLPSESEWEYAARAGADTPWNTGDGIITDDANILNAFGRTVPVGGFPANAFGLHDVHGNVAEYVQDCYEVGYFETPADGRAKLGKTGETCVGVMRGGNYLGEPSTVRSAARIQAGPPGPTQGFRVTRLLD